jgi:uncharacterized protein (TIGR02271 family)
VTRSYSHLNLGDNLKPLSELPDYKVEPGDPDPRGWTVISTDGRSLGRVEDLVIDTSAMKVRHLIVSPAHGASSDSSTGTTLLDASNVDIRNDAHQIVARSLPSGYTGGSAAASAGTGDRETAARSTARGIDRDTGARSTDRDRATLTRSEEELNIGKREVSRGEARVSKHVETEHVSEPVTRRREEVVIERRPVEAGARADATIGESGEIRVPLTEEEVVVEKRPVVKEELVVGKRVVEERDVVETDVRREKFDIDDNVTPGSSNRGRQGR